MKLLVLTVVGTLLGAAWSLPVAPDIAPLQAASCNDSQVVIAADLAVREINKRQDEGNILVVYRINDAHIQNKGMGNTFYLDIYVVDTDCPMVSRKDEKQCKIKPIHETLFGDCHAVIHINRVSREILLYSYNCTLIAPSRKTILSICPDCPLRVTKEGDTLLGYAKQTLHKYNKESNQAKVFEVKEILGGSTQTTEDHALLRDIRPNRWYQFRVAAVNTHGTRGFTTPSKHFHSSKDPTPPETPKNVRIGSVTNRSDGTLQVKIFWDPPQDDDLSIHHYKVSWSPKILRKTPMATKKERLKLTQGNTSEIQLEGFQPNVEYLILVQAVSYWGQKRLKSAKSQLVLMAGQDSISYNHSVPLLEVSNELPSSHVTPSIRRLEAAAPHYSNHQLQVKVFWKKAHDVTSVLTHVLVVYIQGTHFVITGLAFACKYKVTVQPASAAEEGNEAMVFVTTPLCNSVKLKGARNTACLQDEHTNLAGKITLRAEKLMAIFRNVNGSIVGQFHWKVSQNHPSSLPVTGYQFTWTQLSLNSKASSLPDTIISQTQILPPDQLQFTAQNLLPETFYRIQVQVLSLSGNGPAIAKTFETPQLNSTIL
ncbi:KALM protein, partial [Polypterus senegalus]